MEGPALEGESRRQTAATEAGIHVSSISHRSNPLQLNIYSKARYTTGTYVEIEMKHIGNLTTCSDAGCIR